MWEERPHASLAWAFVAGAAVAVVRLSAGVLPGLARLRSGATCGARTRLYGHRRAIKPKKNRTSQGPKKLKSGYWQEGDDDNDIDIYEWISADEFRDEPKAAVTGLREIAAYTEDEGIGWRRYDAPEYRKPPQPLQLQKGLQNPPFVDQGPDISFTDDITEAIAEHGTGSGGLEDADIVTSLDGLRMLLAFVDGSMTEDFRAKGLNTSRKNQPEMVDLFRIARLPSEAPKAIVLGTVWSWVPSNMTPKTGLFNARSYDVSFLKECIGQTWTGGPPSTRELQGPWHNRVLKYECGGLTIVVRTPVVATVPSIDAAAFARPGQVVDVETANWRDAGDLWGYDLATRYARMQLGDVGMLVRGVVDRGSLTDLQELTLEDLELDRPSAVIEAGKLLGRLVALLRKVRDIANCPGCKQRPLWLQYSDAELRIISPRFDDEDNEDADEGVGDSMDMSTEPVLAV